MGNTTNVLLGAPDRTAGYCLSGPIAATMPTSTSAVTSGFQDNGFLTPEGLTITTSRTTEVIKDWNLEAVRLLLTDHEAKLKFTFLEVSVRTLKEYFGEENVNDTGEEIVIRINASAILARAWIFNLKDDATKMRVVAPNASISNQGDIVLVKTAAIKLELELTLMVDAAGEKLYIYKTKPVPVIP